MGGWEGFREGGRKGGVWWGEGAVLEVEVEVEELVGGRARGLGFRFF